MVRDMPSDPQNLILEACHRAMAPKLKLDVNGRGLGELLMLRAVNKAFRLNVDQFVALCVPFLPTALQMKLQTGVERVYRMGAREVAQALQLLLKTINCEFDVDWCRGLIAQDADASVAQDVGTNREKKKHRAAHLIALGCVSFVRVSKMRGERSSKVRIRSFIYTIAFWMLREATRDVQTLDNAERDVISSMATTRLAPGGQSLLPGFSEEEIRKTLTLASQNR